MGYVYLAHFAEPVGREQTEETRALHGHGPRQRAYRPHCRHYLGFSKNVDARLKRHLSGAGAKLVALAAEMGIQIQIVRVWRGTIEDEYRLKRQHNSKRFCPYCSDRPRNPVGLEEVKCWIGIEDISGTCQRKIK